MFIQVLTCFSTKATRRTKSSAAPEDKHEDIKNESTVLDNTKNDTPADTQEDDIPNETQENDEERRVKQKTEGKL